MTLVDQGIGVMVIVIVFGAVAIPVSQSVLTGQPTDVNGEIYASSGSIPEIVEASKVEDGLVPDSETLKFHDFYDESVTNETVESSGSLPEVIQVSDPGNSLVNDSETIYAVNDSSGSSEQLVKGEDYTVVSYETGEFNITSASNIESISDYYKVSYDRNLDQVFELTSSNYSVVSYDSGEFEVDSLSRNVDNEDEYKLSYTYKPYAAASGTTGQILSYVPLALGVALFVASLGLVMS